VNTVVVVGGMLRTWTGLAAASPATPVDTPSAVRRLNGSSQSRSLQPFPPAASPGVSPATFS